MGALHGGAGVDSTFNVMHVNVQGALHKKLDDISVFLSSIDYTIDVLAITEHWLESPAESFVNLPGYRMVSCFSRTMTVHGGSCIFYKGDYACIERNDLKNRGKEVNLECSCIEIKEIKILIMCIYRTGKGSLDEFFVILEDILQSCNTERHRVLLCGDLNIDLLETGGSITRFQDIMTSYSMKQTIFEPTRVTNHSESLIDNIFVNFEYSESKNIQLNISDHKAQHISFEVKNLRSCGRQVAIIRPMTEDRLFLVSEQMKAINFVGVLALIDDVDAAFEYFLRHLTYYFNMFCPKRKTVKRKEANAWVNNEIRQMSNIKRDLYDQYRHGLINKCIYDDFCKHYRARIKQTKLQRNRDYIECSANKGKAIWKIVNTYAGASKANQQNFEVRDLQDNDGEKTVSEILDDANSHIINLCDDYVTDEPLSKLKSTCTNTMFLFPTTPEEIIEIIGALKNTKSAGPDDIPVSLLKYCKQVIAKPLSVLVNLCFRKGKYPEILKRAYVILLHKKGDRKQIGNYRPLALTSNVSKIIEKAIVSRLVDFAGKHKLISNMQNGYLHGRSTVRACFQLVTEVLDMLDRGKPVAGLFLDLSKAFDSVSHRKLLLKLESLGVRGLPLSLLHSFLTDRKQSVRAYHEGEFKTSEWQTVKRGIPQGSTLGPLLFVFYINDLADVVDSKTILFADDTSVIIGSETNSHLKESITNTIQQLQKWFREGDLKMNVDKTKLLNFTTKNDNFELRVQLENVELASSLHTSFLGVVLDSRLGWKQHVSTVVDKLAQFCYALRTLSANADLETCLIAYYAYVYSRLRYGVIVWGNSVESDRVFVAQKRTIRSIFGMKVRESCKPVFKEHNILTFYSIYILECVKFVRNNFDLFEQYKREHSHDTRHRNNLCPSQTSLSLVQRNVVSQCISIYNKLPSTIKDLPTRQCISSLRKCLSMVAFYSVREFMEYKFLDI